MKFIVVCGVVALFAYMVVSMVHQTEQVNESVNSMMAGYGR
ncbi:MULTISPECIES: hypothetical protein [Burkholderia cepacia complex]|nr:MULTISPECIES: hypothetical protein [Burkholderia cepacia complex]